MSSTNILNRSMAPLLPYVPKSIVWSIARRYVAGEDMVNGIEAVKQLNKEGLVATLDVLGEAVETAEEAEQASSLYVELLETINKTNVNSNVSLIHTQMGMKMSPSLCEKQYKKIIDKAKLYGNFVRIDMEDSSVTDQTLKLYDAMRKYYEKVGVVIQSYLFRSSDDIRALKGSGVNLRLCKGAYIEPGDLAYKSKDRGNSLNFLKLAEQILDAGHYVGFATHDRLLISDLIKIIDRKKIPQNKYEFQMLHGVPMGNIMNELKKRNDRVRIYVPFGKQWHPYLLRRIRENPNMISYVILNLFKR